MKAPAFLHITKQTQLQFESTFQIEEGFSVRYDQEVADRVMYQSFQMFCPVSGTFAGALTDVMMETVRMCVMLIQRSRYVSEKELALTLLFRYLNEYLQENEGERYISHPLIIAYVQLIDRAYMDSHHVHYFAKELYVSIRQLNRIFEKYALFSPKQLLDYRLNMEIKQRLLFTSCSIDYIASDIGFSSTEYMYQFFKKKNHMTPKQFLKTYQKIDDYGG